MNIILLDGNCLAARASFALPEDIKGPQGYPINALLGFISMLIRLIRDHTPKQIMVAFDTEGRSFRHQLQPSYKYGRVALIPSFQIQLENIRQALNALSIEHLTRPPFEADDLIATWAHNLAQKQLCGTAITTDRDLIQVIQDPYISLLIPHRGVTSYNLYKEETVKNLFGVSPKKYLEFAALRGDPSDNLPGVKGVGAKTAAKLLNRFGSIAGIMDNLNQLPSTLSKNFQASENIVKTNIQLMKLVRDAPIPDRTALFEPRLWKNDWKETFHGLGLGNLIQRIEDLRKLY